jgi:hypothetical protein
MSDSFDLMLPHTPDLAVMSHRVAQLEEHVKVIYEVRDAVRDLSAEVKLRPVSNCPAPGKCIDLERYVLAMRQEIAEARAAARAASWIAKSVGAIVAFAIAAITLYRLIATTG